MANEQEYTEEVVEEIEEYNTEEVSEDTTEEVVEQTEEKPKETLEAKQSRLKRQLSQVNKKLGVEAPKVKQDAPKGDLSTKDLYALMQANVPESDVDSVVKVARHEGISVAEALKTDLAQTILEKNAEKRNVADATNTGSTAQTNAAKTGEELLTAAEGKGEVPESDSDMATLAEARINSQRNSSKN